MYIDRHDILCQAKKLVFRVLTEMYILSTRLVML